MKTYFVTSDIHSYYSIWRNALAVAGFEEENKDHYLIILGDLFDRGQEAKKLYAFLRAFPKERRILVRGNHEDLLRDLLRRGFPLSRDYHNCTTDTLEQFGRGVKRLKKRIAELDLDLFGDLSMEEYVKERNATYKELQRRLYQGKAIHEVLDWIYSDEWQDYYETPHYVFVHAWVPLRIERHQDVYDPDWRNASQKHWEDARWGCPYKYYQRGLWNVEFANGKTLVCGHWHTGDFYNNLDYAANRSRWIDVQKCNPIYKSENFPGLIGIDACTALTKTCNVLVLQEEEL